MKTQPLVRLQIIVACVLGCCCSGRVFAQVQPQFTRVQPITNREIALTLSGQAAAFYQIDAATNLFVCMNQPYPMTVAQATNAITAFHPKVVYPYHYQDQGGTTANAATFKQRLRQDLGIEVRLRKWY